MQKDRIIVPDPEDIDSEEIGPVMAQMAAIQLTLATRLVTETKDRGQEDSESLLTVGIITKPAAPVENSAAPSCHRGTHAAPRLARCH